jgi:hypothetical protein
MTVVDVVGNEIDVVGADVGTGALVDVGSIDESSCSWSLQADETASNVPTTSTERQCRHILRDARP